MALDVSLLESEIRKINDQEYELFEGFPETNIEVAERWSNAINLYASKVTPPSANSELARQAMYNIFLTLSVNALTQFPIGFTAYAVQLGLGMQPNFTAIPPPIPIVLAPTFAIGLAGGSSVQCAKSMATIIDAWFRTGISINNVSSVSVPWS